MDFSQVNFLAVLVAALATMAIGAIWYSKLLLGNVWMKANDFKEDDPPGNVARTMIITFILSLVMSFNLAAFLATPETDVVFGITAGFLAGFGWVALSIAVIAMFERRSFAYMAVNGGYWVVSFVAMGAILGAWR
jgi:hypothetical protein